MILSSHGYSLSVDGNYGPQTQRAVRHWQKSNGLYVDGVPGPVTMQSLRNSITGPADVSQTAKRLNPPRAVGLNGLDFAPPGLDACAEMVWYMREAGLPERFGDAGRHSNWVRSDGFGWRESKCNNSVVSRTGCCVGYWQNYISSHLSKASRYRERIINECGVQGRDDILGDSGLAKQKQACVTKVVFDISGLSPWS
jgi:peptidoglycan hydrolase-like protein with peptidoglycan-binding domain